MGYFEEFLVLSNFVNKVFSECKTGHKTRRKARLRMRFAFLPENHEQNLLKLEFRKLIL